MIIFDTNAVNLLPPDGPRAEIIRKLRESGHHRVAVPWMVLEEMAAHQAALYPVRYQSVLNVLQKLREVLPWELESSLEPLALERLLNHWRDVYLEIFEVIDTSGDVARKALAREALALPPAKRNNDHSEGARDVAIWLSILEFLKENPKENVCFVTNNTKDFGDGTTYSYPMDEDIRGFESRFTRLTDFDQVVSEFTNEVSNEEAESAAGELLRSLPIQARLAQTAVEILTSATGFVGLDVVNGVVQWRSWMTPPEAELLSFTDVTGHEIEGDTWYTAKALWLLYGPATDGSKILNIACGWEVKLLFSTKDGGQTPTLLTPGEPSPPDMSDDLYVAALKRLKDRAAALARRTSADSPGRSSAAGNNLAEQWAAAMPKLDIAGIMPGANLAEQWAAAMPKLDIAGIMPGANLAEQWAAAMPTIAGIMPGANLAEQWAAAMPNIAGIMPGANLAEQWAAAMPNIAGMSGSAISAGANNPSSDDQLEADKDEEPEKDISDSP